MKVSVSLFTILKRYGENKVSADGTMDLPEAATLGHLADLLCLPAKPAKVYLVNGLNRKAEHVLAANDDVKIFSFIGGG